MDAALVQKSGGRLYTSMDDRTIETNSRRRNSLYETDKQPSGDEITCKFRYFERNGRRFAGHVLFFENRRKTIAMELLFGGVISGKRGSSRVDIRTISSVESTVPSP